jgi:hypothetical protein
MTTINGPLIPNFRAPFPTRIVQETGAGARHEISSHNQIVHAIGETGIPASPRVIHISAVNTACLAKFLRAVFIPRLMQQDAFNATIGPWLDKLANQEKKAVIDLTRFYHWNFDVWRDNKEGLGRDGLGMRFIFGQYIPGGLEFAKVWAFWDVNPPEATSKVTENFYTNCILPQARSFQP